MHSGKSLVHCLVKLLQKEMNGGNKMILKQGFTLASILVLSSECQGILWKVSLCIKFKQKMLPTSYMQSIYTLIWQILFFLLKKIP